jgi:hypothetical protein
MRRILGALTWLFILLAIACSARPPSTSGTPDARLTITHYMTGIGDPDVWFIRDSDSNDCWIYVSTGRAGGLQPASSASCTRGERRGAERRPDGSP